MDKHHTVKDTIPIQNKIVRFMRVLALPTGPGRSGVEVHALS